MSPIPTPLDGKPRPNRNWKVVVLIIIWALAPALAVALAFGVKPYRAYKPEARNPAVDRFRVQALSIIRRLGFVSRVLDGFYALYQR